MIRYSGVVLAAMLVAAAVLAVLGRRGSGHLHSGHLHSGHLHSGHLHTATRSEISGAMERDWQVRRWDALALHGDGAQLRILRPGALLMPEQPQGRPPLSPVSLEDVDVRAVASAAARWWRDSTPAWQR